MYKATIVLGFLISCVVCAPTGFREDKAEQNLPFQKGLTTSSPESHPVLKTTKPKTGKTPKSTILPSVTKPISKIENFIEEDHLNLSSPEPQLVATLPPCLSNETYFKDKCVGLFTQGPCHEGEWVVTKGNLGSCSSRPAPCDVELPEKSEECLQELLKDSPRICNITEGMTITLLNSGDVDCTCRNGYIYVQESCYKLLERGPCPEGYGIMTVKIYNPTETTTAETPSTTTFSSTRTAVVTTTQTTETTKTSKSGKKTTVRTTTVKKMKSTTSRPRTTAKQDLSFAAATQATTQSPLQKTTVGVNIQYIDEMDNTGFSFIGGRRTNSTGTFPAQNGTIIAELPKTGEDNVLEYRFIGEISVNRTLKKKVELQCVAVKAKSEFKPVVVDTTNEILNVTSSEQKETTGSSFTTVSGSDQLEPTDKQKIQESTLVIRQKSVQQAISSSKPPSRHDKKEKIKSLANNPASILSYF